MNEFVPATDGYYIYGELSNGNQVKIRVVDLLNILLSKVNTFIPVRYNTPTLIAEGVGFLIIQQVWIRVDVSTFFVSNGRIRIIFDDFNLFRNLSIDGEKVYWNETNPSHTSIRGWLIGYKNIFSQL